MTEQAHKKDVPTPVFPAAPVTYPMYDEAAIHNEQAWQTMNVHDPGIFRDDDGTYYVYSTDVQTKAKLTPGVMVRKSKDLIAWEWVGRALPGIPEHAKEETGATNLWAPDVFKHGDTYRMYYSASSFGTNGSLIGLMTAKSPEGPWEDHGVAIRTKSGEPGPNAIDAQITVDAMGSQWLLYGSFFDGIHITRLHAETGLPAEPGFGKRIAARDKATREGAVEGPYIMYHEGFRQYYLFVSYDSLFRNYNVRVGRSDFIDGPYVDFNGRRLDDIHYMPQSDVGTKLMGGYEFSEGEGWVMPGHNSVLREGEDWYMVHHARGKSNPHWPYLHVRRITWTPDGWPVVSPERYAGEKEQPIPAELMVGEWETIVHLPEADTAVESEKISIQPNGTISGSAFDNGQWQLDEQSATLSINWQDKNGESRTAVARVLTAWDWERSVPTVVFTGLDDRGIAIWGKRTKE
ncbi:arabinan endo-1,5-alpha-L-arabinosidase [Paenibacillus cellulosilyticus]|uniref:Arabinan endo-1,5-alpha-L-arabinosidase n=1 Tax=Paenibacillus cellulosilyticus TaxID=375489 RepID=A0A2V2Z1Y6_9BACL|nr:arabinan endo-1,5-alpha-L-arabinosidase [Paenibacillus cellulosilyticus]PWW07145.1 arabinan endo-1,5-alpha-L-arabinosidase [Paenibacillus cellulosilyticus]QKS44647.1 arabinan endo-1,5-alpha-L-arabinosidase [Paenibacillus cellulosilyticus]